MRTSDRILRQVRRALFAAFALSGLASLLLAVLALHALPLLPRDLALPQPEPLTLLAASGATALLALLCLDAARGRILQRAGLWLDHTLAHHILINAARQGAPANALKAESAAIARLRDALLEGAVTPVLAAPWTLIGIAALTLLHPLLAALVAVSAAALVLTALFQAAPVARLEQQRLRAGERVAAWWRGLPPTPLPPEASPEWERLNRAFVAAAYALDRRLLVLSDAGRSVRALALLATIALGLWLLAHEQLTPGGLVAGVLLAALTLAPLVGLLASLRSVRRAMLDYRRLAAWPAERRPSYPTYPALDAERMPLPAFTTAPVPRLHLGGPLALGYGAFALLLSAAVAAAALLPPQLIAGVAGDARLAAHTVPVRHAKGGVTARLHVARGAEVKAGDLLLTLDTTALDRQIAALRSDAEAARAKLDSVGHEVAILAALTPATLADRARLRLLETELAELQQRADALPARIAAAEVDLGRSVVRAPVSGRVVSLAVRGPNDAIAPGSVIAEIATDRQGSLLDRIAEPLLRQMHRVLRSFTQENAA